MELLDSLPGIGFTKAGIKFEAPSLPQAIAAADVIVSFLR